MGSADADVRRRRLRWYPVPAWFGVVLVLTAINVVSAFFGGPHVGSHSQIAVWDVAVVAASVAFQVRAHRCARPAVEVSPTPACLHGSAVPVELASGGERVAWLCPDCDEQLSADWAPRLPDPNRAIVQALQAKLAAPAVNGTLRDSVLRALAEGIEREAQRITIEVRRSSARPVAKVTAFAAAGDRLKVSKPLPAGAYTVRRPDGVEFGIGVVACHLGVTDCTLMLTGSLRYSVMPGALVYGNGSA